MATIDLYEGNGGSQSLLYTVRYKAGKNIKFEGHDDIPNDEARSCVLNDMPVGAVIKFFDDPDGGTDDDWCKIKVLKTHQQYTVASFERTYEDEYVAVTYHRDNGLDGRVSRMEMS